MQHIDKYTIFAVFSPTTGKVQSIHIKEFGHVPTDAIRISSAQYKRLLESDNWVYDWDNDTLKYEVPVEEPNLDEMRIEAHDKINARVETEILAGFTVKIDGHYAKFDCDLTAQQNITQQVIHMQTRAQAASNPEEFYKNVELVIRCYVDGAYDKSTLEINGLQLLTVYDAMNEHIDMARKRGWAQKDYVTAGERTIAELETYLKKI